MVKAVTQIVIQISVVKKTRSRSQLSVLSLCSGELCVAHGNTLLLAAGSQMLPEPSNKPYMFPLNLGGSEELVSPCGVISDWLLLLPKDGCPHILLADDELSPQCTFDCNYMAKIKHIHFKVKHIHFKVITC